MKKEGKINVFIPQFQNKLNKLRYCLPEALSPHTAQMLLLMEVPGREPGLMDDWGNWNGLAWIPPCTLSKRSRGN